MKYFVSGTAGPGFASPEEAMHVLDNVILPSFDILTKLESAGTITGGLPVGDRAFVFVAEAASNEALDELLRSLPMWGSLDWEVTPLQSFEGRASMERRAVGHMKAAGA
jgi:hypothetical protein